MIHTIQITELYRFWLHWLLLSITGMCSLIFGPWALVIGVVAIGMFHIAITLAALLPTTWTRIGPSVMFKSKTGQQLKALAPAQFISFLFTFLFIFAIVLIPDDEFLDPFYFQTVFGGILMLGIFSNLSVSVTLVRLLFRLKRQPSWLQQYVLWCRRSTKITVTFKELCPIMQYRLLTPCYINQ